MEPPVEPKKPIIGISGTHINGPDGVILSPSTKAMRMLIQKAGGEVLIIDHRSPPEFSSLDGLVLMGNDYDIDPARYGQKRRPESRVETERYDRSDVDFELARLRADFEYRAIAEAEHLKLPLFAVCGGMHRINVAKGGTLKQFVGKLEEFGNQGRDTNKLIVVTIEPNSMLNSIALKPTLLTPYATYREGPCQQRINQSHHQAIDQVAPDFRSAATSQHEGQPMIEAIESTRTDWYVMGVQWHPEMLPDNPLTVRLGESFVGAAREHQQAKGQPAEDTNVGRGPLAAVLRRAPITPALAPTSGPQVVDRIR